MSLISKPYTFSNGAVIYAAEHNSNFDTIITDYNGGITGDNISASAAIAYTKLALSGSIVNSDINTSAAIADTKLAQITTASKVSGTAITGLASTPSGAGALPIANGGTGQITAQAALDALLPSQSGKSGYSLVSDGTNGAWSLLSTVTQANDTDSGTNFDNNPEVTFLTKAKTITSGKTVLLIATGYLFLDTKSLNSYATIKLKNGSTISQTIVVTLDTSGQYSTWAASGIVTGLSGSVTFSVTAQASSADLCVAYGNLNILEF